MPSQVRYLGLRSLTIASTQIFRFPSGLRTIWKNKERSGIPINDRGPRVRSLSNPSCVSMFLFFLNGCASACFFLLVRSAQVVAVMEVEKWRTIFGTPVKVRRWLPCWLPRMAAYISLTVDWME